MSAISKPNKGQDRKINAVKLDIPWSDLGSWKEICKMYDKNKKKYFNRKNIFHRPWGKYVNLFKGKEFLIKEIHVKSKGILSLQKHFHRAEHWVVIDEETDIKVVFIFREEGNQLLISSDGKIEKGTWEYLGNNSILIDRKDGSFLFKHGFIDDYILALKIDGKDEYALLVNEIKFEERKTIEQIEESTELAPKFDHDGLIPVVTTDFSSGEVLMQGYMNDEAFKQTIVSGREQKRTT
jgi:hypothetical protein